MKKEFYMKLLRFLVLMLTLISIYFLLNYTFLYIYPFLIAIAIAFLLHPFVTMLELKWKMNRALATFLIMLCFFTALLLVAYFLLKRLVEESASLVHTVPEHFQTIKLMFTQIGQTLILPFYEKLEKAIPFLPPFEELKFDDYFHVIIDEVGASSSFFFKNIFQTTSTILSSISYGGTILIFIVLSVFIMTKDFHKLKAFFIKLVPDKVINAFNEVITHLKNSAFGFIKAQVIITIISSIIVMIGLFAFRVENVLMITIIVFFVDFIPYLGIGIVFIPWIIYNFFADQYLLTIQLAALYIVIIIVRQLIEPRILASSIGIHPLIALIILFVGIQSFGLAGIFIVPIVLIAFSAIYHAGIIHYIWNFIQKG